MQPADHVDQSEVGRDRAVLLAVRYDHAHAMDRLSGALARAGRDRVGDGGEAHAGEMSRIHRVGDFLRAQPWRAGLLEGIIAAASFGEVRALEEYCARIVDDSGEG